MIIRLVCYYARRVRDWLRAQCPHLPSWMTALWERPKAWYACFAPGMRKIRLLSVAAGARVVFLPANRLAHLFLSCLPGCLGVLVWGEKEYAEPQYGSLHRKRLFALAFARMHTLSLVRVEDGFLRSLDLGVQGDAPLSLIFDRKGMYYDAQGPSELEDLLASDWTLSAAEAEAARRAIADICRYRLSKYNHAPAIQPFLERTRRRTRVLVLDQTKGDVSVLRGGADAATFVRMLHDAVAEHPEEEIWIKVHPDVVAGKKRGYFSEMSLPACVQVVAFDCAPLALLEAVDCVYTVTSQMGFEALLMGKTVHCYGLPFYAGWGLTRDTNVSPRRTKKRSLLEVFWAAYGKYPRYLDPAISGLGDLTSVIRRLAVARTVNEANRGAHVCLGFYAWKERHARAFLGGTASTLFFAKDADEALALAAAKSADIAVWASRMPKGLPARCAQAGIQLLRVEDGFLRSVGLGSNFYAPGSLVVDPIGIYYDPTKPSLLEAEIPKQRSAADCAYADEIRELLISSGVTKYNMQTPSDLPTLPSTRPILLVPGQVEDDASVRLGGLGIASNSELVAAVRAANPTAYLLYKEHPDVVAGNRRGALSKEAISLVDAVIRTTPMDQVLPHCDEVHTLTSLTGFEALLRGIPVVTYGGPFYAGWGCTRDRHTFPRRQPVPLLALIYAALVVYPRYYDWENHTWMDAAAAVRHLAKVRSKGYLGGPSRVPGVRGA